MSVQNGLKILYCGNVFFFCLSSIQTIVPICQLSVQLYEHNNEKLIQIHAHSPTYSYPNRPERIKDLLALCIRMPVWFSFYHPEVGFLGSQYAATRHSYVSSRQGDLPRPPLLALLNTYSGPKGEKSYILTFLRSRFKGIYEYHSIFSDIRQLKPLKLTELTAGIYFPSQFVLEVISSSNIRLVKSVGIINFSLKDQDQIIVTVS